MASGHRPRPKRSRGSGAIPYIGLAVLAVAAVALTGVALSSARPSGGGTSGAAPSASESPSPVTVSILGDSHAAAADGWWRQTVGAGTVDGVREGAFEAYEGATASALTEHLDAATADGGLVVVQAGTYDLEAGRTAGETATDVAALWQGVLDRGATPVAALLPPSGDRGEETDDVNRRLRDGAADRGIDVLDLTTAVQGGEGDWKSGLTDDGVLANATAAARMAQAADEQLGALAGR
ncbi:SGNH/GDSL hydrolase family protein [Frigoribacterium faeni]|uniref:SGNH hydrolase-type esterase domain-containing protein n=1 Tax=Frigoribacterium faeni TaxID=145483 RepID=A0A7W3JGX8_9MICO|nr:SGNH/GDSL hydrolase family protein [Frigoribacterium faeni]MBA8812611.1 hypothetical protein [Frigoribacterium faeni]BFF13713.1 hypothetical protein GCM10025699_50160 [Microbacterium flavescens]GEK82376.1 hypothetical protein FFA01_06850 [Frigoribacterium faeni]